MTQKFGNYFVNIHTRVLVYAEYCQRGQPLLTRLSHKLLGKFSATFKFSVTFKSFATFDFFLAFLKLFFTFFARFLNFRKKSHLN